MTAETTRDERIPQDLIVRYVAGDRDAFQAIFDELSRDVYFVVRRLFRSAFDQEEAQQEVWLHLYRMRRQVDVNRPREFVAWVRRVARNRTIDILKSRGRRHEIPVEEIGDVQDEAHYVEAVQPRALADRQVRAVIEAFVADLDDEKRAFFGLCFVEERSHPEIAKGLAMTVRRSKYLKKILLAQLLELPGLREHLE
ncbi:MAG: RNA polymerase sigma factor [Deltaproteobacteria bacterium]|nr:RNA polymerase sigma factor [Deltaproteobacteria bacterium]